MHKSLSGITFELALRASPLASRHSGDKNHQSLL